MIFQEDSMSEGRLIFTFTDTEDESAKIKSSYVYHQSYRSSSEVEQVTQSSEEEVTALRTFEDIVSHAHYQMLISLIFWD